MTELTCWPLDNKEYTAEALGAAYAARSRGILHAADFTATANGDGVLDGVAELLGCSHSCLKLDYLNFGDAVLESAVHHAQEIA